MNADDLRKEYKNKPKAEIARCLSQLKAEDFDDQVNYHMCMAALLECWLGRPLTMKLDAENNLVGFSL